MKRGSWLIVSLAVAALSACGEPSGETASSSPVPEREATEAVSSGTVFDLSSEKRGLLAKRALAGDADAAFRLAQFYSMAGGESDLAVNDEHDMREELRWLEMATSNGHETAKFNLAVRLASEDCPRARRMLTEIIASTNAESTRNGARSWLKNRQFDCG